MNKCIKKIFVIVFCFILGFFMLVTLSNNEIVSEVERRKLTTFPKFSLSSIVSKKYYDNLTSAFSDQLAFRKYLVKGYFLFNFQRYFGDAVIGHDKQLYSPSQSVPSSTYYKKLKNVINLVNEESEKIDAKFMFLSIPRKDAYMINELPKNYNSSLDIYNKQVKVVKENLSNDIIFIDALDVFKSNNIYNCYYSNDHHITPRCAYLLYNEINKYTGTFSYNLDDEFEVKKTIVNGGYSRQLGQTIKSSPEDLYLVPKKSINYIRYENDKLSKKKVFGKGTSYEDAYMEGDMAYTVIDTDNVFGKSIMFVGSSYTNILEALSVPSYRKIVSVDYRHNKTGKSINDYVMENNIDYVVFVPGQSTNAYSLKQIELHLGQ